MQQAIQEAKKMQDEYKERGFNGHDLYKYSNEIFCLDELIERLEAKEKLQTECEKYEQYKKELGEFAYSFEEWKEKIYLNNQ